MAWPSSASVPYPSAVSRWRYPALIASFAIVTISGLKAEKRSGLYQDVPVPKPNLPLLVHCTSYRQLIGYNLQWESACHLAALPVGSEEKRPWSVINIRIPVLKKCENKSPTQMQTWAGLQNREHRLKSYIPLQINYICLPISKCHVTGNLGNHLDRALLQVA